MRILLVDDETISRNLLQFQLEQWGHVVQSASDGTQAWDLLQIHDYRVVITDWNMPGMTGIDLLRKIRASHCDAYIYVILLTSNSEKEALVTGMTTGADDFLTKPVDPNELQARLHPSRRIIDLEHRLAERNRELEGRNKQLSDTNAKTKRDLDAAAQIQQAFLPSRVQEIPHVRIAWRYSPCNELGGDMLNVLRLDEQHVGVYVLDVSGHGVQASLMAVAACRHLSSYKDGASALWRRRDGSSDYCLLSPAAAVAQINFQFVAQSLGEQYFTLVYGILNQNSGEFRYALAGHPPPVHAPASDPSVFLSGNGVPIGIIETDYEEHSIQLQSGDRLFFYSDGVTETMDVNHELFGNSRLLQTLENTSDYSLDTTLTETLRHIAVWRGDAPIHDDISMLALEYCPGNAFREPGRSPENSPTVVDERMNETETEPIRGLVDAC
ncbi:MAG TPA: SpoIIE family protein phosphatase [Planctomycetaceae bacterium]|nr:SpoIIE family protein phosphatase [Planctomycetaceae bacterium]